MDGLTVDWVQLHPCARKPTKAHDTDAGWDLYTISGPQRVAPGVRVILETGIVAVPPPGWWWLLTRRSSSPLDVTLAVIDAGYQGELLIHATNRGNEAVIVNQGDRLAQLVLLPVVSPAWVQHRRTLDLPRTPRGVKGYGSSGRA